MVGRGVPCPCRNARQTCALSRSKHDIKLAQAKPEGPALFAAGLCAGVVRAIESVERALAIYGAPVYVRHEIVHNRYVVEGLRAKGAIFVEELSEVPDDHAPVIFPLMASRVRFPRRPGGATCSRSMRLVRS